MKKKVCIIGVNYSYKILFQSLKILKNFDILGIAGRKKRKEFKKEKFLYYTSWKNMIDELKPDLVVIGVPPKEQEKILEFLLIKNIDFLCEKPITNDLKRINLYKNLVKKNSNKNLIDLNFLTIPAIQKFKNIIKKIEISKKDQIKIEWFLKPRSLKDKLSWKNNPKKIGGEINNFFFHLISIIFYLFGSLDISLISKEKNFYIFLFSSRKINFEVNFFTRSKINKFKIEVNNRNNKYSLNNNSKDYHNNYFIKKNNSIVFKKNFLKDKSRIFASKDILSLFLKKNHELEKHTNFNKGLEIQKKIINLKC